MRSNTHFSDIAMLVVALTAMVLTGTHADESAAQPGAISTMACYVALASDITPLVDATLPDVVSASPECVAQTNAADGKKRRFDGTRPNVGNRKGAKASDSAPAEANPRTNRSGTAPSVPSRGTN